MKIITLSKKGISTPKVMVGGTKDGKKYYYLAHGEQGIYRWQYRLPLDAKDFPVFCNREFDLSGKEFDLKDLGKQDEKGNQQYLLVRGKSDGRFLVLWELDPGYRGEAYYKIEGDAEVIAEGREEQGVAVRVGGAPCPIVLVKGPCALRWHRGGELYYYSTANFVAKFDGENWSVEPDYKY